MNEPVRVDQYRRRTLLGTSATYRVVQLDGDHAVVQVVDAPGLETGMRVRLTMEAVSEMEVVDLEDEVDHALARLAAPA